MDERANGRMILVVLTLMLVAGGIIFFGWKQLEASGAVGRSVDTVVPTASSFEAKLGHIDRAQDVADQINARQANATGQGNR